MLKKTKLPRNTLISAIAYVFSVIHSPISPTLFINKLCQALALWLPLGCSQKGILAGLRAKRRVRLMYSFLWLAPAVPKGHRSYESSLLWERLFPQDLASASCPHQSGPRNGNYPLAVTYILHFFSLHPTHTSRNNYFMKVSMNYSNFRAIHVLLGIWLTANTSGRARCDKNTNDDVTFIPQAFIHGQLHERWIA